MNGSNDSLDFYHEKDPTQQKGHEMPDQNEMELSDLLNQNKEWAKQKRRNNKDYFQESFHFQYKHKPKYFWVDCSFFKNALHPNEIISAKDDDASPTIYTYRNIINTISCNIDLSFMSTLQYAVNILKVNHIVICGSYGHIGLNESNNTGFHLPNVAAVNLHDV